MLSSSQIRGHKFVTVSRGVYKSEDVDDFLNDVADSFDRVSEENGELVKRVSLLADKISEYRKESDLIQKTLLTAQRKADELEAEAEVKANETLEKASVKEQEILNYAEMKSRSLIDQADTKAYETVKNAERRAAELISDTEKKAAEILDTANSASAQQLKLLESQIEIKQAIFDELSAKSEEFRAKIIGVSSWLLDYSKSIPSIENAQNETGDTTSESQESAAAEDAVSEIYDETKLEYITEAEVFEEQDTAEEIKSEDADSESDAEADTSGIEAESEETPIVELDDSIFNIAKNENSQISMNEINTESSEEAPAEDQAEASYESENSDEPELSSESYTENELSEISFDESYIPAESPIIAEESYDLYITEENEEDEDSSEASDNSISLDEANNESDGENDGFRLFLESFAAEEDGDFEPIAESKSPNDLKYPVFDDDDDDEPKQSRFKGLFKK